MSAIPTSVPIVGTSKTTKLRNDLREMFLQVVSDLVTKKSIFDEPSRIIYARHFGQISSNRTDVHGVIGISNFGDEITNSSQTSQDNLVNSPVSASEAPAATTAQLHVSARDNPPTPTAEVDVESEPNQDLEDTLLVDERTSECSNDSTFDLKDAKGAKSVNQKLAKNKSPEAATATGSITKGLVGRTRSDLVNQNKNDWIEKYRNLDVSSIELTERKRDRRQFAIARTQLEAGDFIVFLRGRVVPTDRAKRLLNQPKSRQFIINIGTENQSLYFDTSNYSDWPGNFISRDESSANCNVREIEINGKPQYCYYATKHISKGARFSFFPVSESERMNPVV